MGKFTHGQPGWTEIQAAMRFVGACHDGQVSLIISPLGTGGNGGFATAVEFTGDALSGTDQLRMLSVTGKWPTSEGTTLVGHLLSGIYQLDWLLAKDFKTRIEKAAEPSPG